MRESLDNNISIIIPCFNENTTVVTFLHELCNVLVNLPFQFKVVIVDDSSTDNTIDLLLRFNYECENIQIKIITLKYNLGHQGAIYQGFLYARRFPCEKYIVIDADGEDDPLAINELVFMKHRIVHAVRGKRSEKLGFKILLKVYKLLFSTITGKNMNFGNYCMIDEHVFNKACYTSFVHLAAYLSKQNVDKTELKYDRMKRIDGTSKMNLSSLIHHAFRSFVEYSEAFLMLFFKIFLLITIAIFILLGVVLYKKLIINDAILGWASSMSISLINSALISFGFFVIGILLLNILNKNNLTSREIFIDILEDRTTNPNL